VSSFPQRVVIVGFGAAGLTAAEVLRQQGFDGALTILSAEDEEPYDRPTLSKHYLAGEFDLDKIRLVSTARIEGLAARILWGRRGISLDLVKRVVTDSHGEGHAYDALVIATGVEPRTLAVAKGVDGVHMLRTREDADVLRSCLSNRGSLLVVGGGFLGLEVAATAQGLGSGVTVVERGGAPLANHLGAEVADRLARIHREHGVILRTSVGLVSLRADDVGRLDQAVLSDGSIVRADTALIAVGSVPDLHWLQSSGLTLSDGIVCDEFSKAAEGVWAAGDVARWHHRGLGRSVRFEHRMNASDQGRHVARNILGADEPFAPVPFFWTDHFDVRIQFAGARPTDMDPTVVAGALAEDSFVVEYRGDSGLEGALGWNAVKELMPLRRELAARVAGAA
jgi:3-phenylpropionate/trans-cinnamate dioxygenase ferredoxin reductase subunit